MYKEFEIRGFDFTTLGKVRFLSGDPEIPGRTSALDILLMRAQQSGDADLLRYLVKDLGLTSTIGGFGISKCIAGDGRSLGGQLSTQEADLAKYECASCEVIGATKQCGGCKMVRYCSKDCSRRHWKTGGHKAECKELQRRAALTSTGAAGPS